MHVFLLLHFFLWVRPSHRSFRDKHALGLSHFECSWKPGRTGRRRRDLRPTARSIRPPSRRPDGLVERNATAQQAAAVGIAVAERDAEQPWRH